MKPGKILKRQHARLKKLQLAKKIKPKKRIKQILFWSTLSVISSILILLFILYVFPKLPINPGPIAKMQAYALAARKIASKALIRNDKQTTGNSAQQIIQEIVKDRTTKNYLYAGGHYTDFYIRNLGTFANKMIEPQAATNAADWLERVKLMTRSTEVALSVFENYNDITTTIVQIENGKYVPINVFVKPSDSLPSILKILYQLQNISEKYPQFTLDENQRNELLVVSMQAHAMTNRYQQFLKQQSQDYINTLSDAKTGLIKTNITLSGIKDSWIRQSSLYDNVMLWSVYYYSAQLDLFPDWGAKAEATKQKIISERWNAETGIFFDELPSQSCHPYKKTKCLPYFSADNLITYEMGMLKPQNVADRQMLERMIQYVQGNNLDKPFPLKTTEVRFPSKEHLPVRIFAPNYTGTTIWSYWGMIYIDLLNTIGKFDNNTQYQQTAKNELESYTENIILYKGFPELYNPKGQQYRLPFYRSVNDMVWGIYYLYLDNQINHK